MYVTEPEFKQRTDLHLARKLWHVIGVLVMAAIFAGSSRSTALQLMTSVAFLAVLLDLARHRWPSINHILTTLFRPVMREHERHSLAGTTYLMLGVFLVIFVFPRSVVLLSLLFLAMADPLASYVGIRHGRDKILGNKSLQGSLAAFAICTLISGAYFFYNGLMLERLVIVSILAGLIGALSELIPIFNLDDNLTFPLVSSSLLYCLFYLFGGFTL